MRVRRGEKTESKRERRTTDGEKIKENTSQDERGVAEIKRRG
jgi:hypothetical protein